MIYKSLREIADIAQEGEKPFWRVVLDCEAAEQAQSFEEVFEKMRSMYRAMKYADEHYDPELRSPSGMAGGDGAKLEKYRLGGKALLDGFICLIMETAVKMGESNACMKRIVAAPTAGSCGVLPAVLLSYEKHRGIEEDRLVEALFVAGGIGEIIAENAGISGAEGGCQAEIGSASAMAAGAVAYLEGGDTECILNAVALAMKNMLGLTCDPVAGLVEVPCIKRNVSGAVNAVVSAQTALAGVTSVIPADEVIDSMRRIGRMLPECLRETSKDGLAVTDTALRITDRLHG